MDTGYPVQDHNFPNTSLPGLTRETPDLSRVTSFQHDTKSRTLFPSHLPLMQLHLKSSATLPRIGLCCQIPLPALIPNVI